MTLFPFFFSVDETIVERRAIDFGGYVVFELIAIVFVQNFKKAIPNPRRRYDDDMAAGDVVDFQSILLDFSCFLK